MAHPKTRICLLPRFETTTRENADPAQVKAEKVKVACLSVKSDSLPS